MLLLQQKKTFFFLSGWKVEKKRRMSLKITFPHLSPKHPPSLSFDGPLSRFSPMVFLYLSTVIPSIWFLELSLLQSKLPVNNSSGPELHPLARIPIAAVGAATKTTACSHIQANT